MSLLLAIQVGATAYTLNADSGAYAITGAAAAFSVNRSFVALPGSYTITGRSATLTLSRSFVALPGSYAISGKVATITVNRSFVASPGLYAITGMQASFRIQLSAYLDPGLYAITGRAADLVYLPVGGVPAQPPPLTQGGKSWINPEGRLNKWYRTPHKEVPLTALPKYARLDDRLVKESGEAVPVVAGDSSQLMHGEPVGSGEPIAGSDDAVGKTLSGIELYEHLMHHPGKGMLREIKSPKKGRDA